MNSIQVYKDKLNKKLNEKNKFTEILGTIEEKTGVQRLYIALGVLAFLALYLMVGYGATFLASFIGFVYPAYCSVKAIESSDKSDDTKWLTYWVVYGVFSLMEFFTDIFLFWIPLYAFMKCIFLVYCMAPTSWNGSVTIYYRIIRPFVLRHESQIDAVVDRARNVAGDVMDEASEISKNAVGEAVAHQISSSYKTD